ncbi:pyridoxamine 5'-phosphate oxidase [Deinococcus sp.]|uniref:pyridoxamine 5'-phosphate oxidase n=1 Tax=Deinococcus sp. TaxID=47478 RepID=UPI003B59DF61
MEPTIQVREEFTRPTLHRRDLLPDPLAQLRRWLGEAQEAGEPDAYAMTLATVNADGLPNARMVLLKQIDEWGLVFTSSSSPKTQEFAAQPVAALVFYWPRQERQIRIQGRIEPLSAAESDCLYAPRVHRQRLTLLTFPQSQPIANRAALDVRFAALEKQYQDHELPRPADWNGWRVVPNRLEFWQGGRARLHDRLRYTRSGEGWQVERLAP